MAVEIARPEFSIGEPDIRLGELKDDQSQLVFLEQVSLSRVLLGLLGEGPMQLAQLLLVILKVHQLELNCPCPGAVHQVLERSQHPLVLLRGFRPDPEVLRNVRERPAAADLLFNREESVDVGVRPPGVVAELQRELNRVDVRPRAGLRKYTHTDTAHTQLTEGRNTSVAVDENPVPGDESRLVLAVLLQAGLEVFEVTVALGGVRRQRLQQVAEVVLAFIAPCVGREQLVTVRVEAALRSNPVR